MQVTFGGHTLTAKAVQGGKEMYQGARREYLDFVFEPDGMDVGELDALFAAGTEEITLAYKEADPETGEMVDAAYVHTGYVIRGAIRLYPLADGSREIAVRQYQRTEAEMLVEQAEARIEAAVAIVPALAAMQATSAGSDAGAMRALAATLAPVAGALPTRDWAVGMTTQPGDTVWDPAHRYTYLYAKAEAMTHSNYTYFPGASGVYYWSIVPEMHEGVKVYPAVTGIIVSVKQGEEWWNPDKTKKYRWNAADWTNCSYAPGAPGAHQWVAA